MKLSIILPSYEESENLEKIIPKIKSTVETKITMNYEILVIDTMQPRDRTPNICKSVGVRYIPRRCGNNYGDAIRTGIQDAHGSYILVMDSDGSHNPDDIVKLYQNMLKETSDVIIGSRYIEGGSTSNGFVLRMMSHIVNMIYSTLFDLHIRDVSNSFRIYRAELLKSIDLKCDNFDVVEEILIKLKRKYKGIVIVEVPISFHKRDKGNSKRNLWKFIVSYVITIFKLWKIKDHSL